jgi:polyvinyl alcohol dehydrogenase (cytochrome)
MLWKTYTVPSNNGNSESNLPGYYSGNAVWASSPVVDPARGLLYVGTGNNYTVPSGVCTSPGQTGCTQPAADDYVDSILR